MKAEQARAMLGAVAGGMVERLPDDCAWLRTEWAALDPASLRHVYSEDWAALSGGTGRLDESAAAVREGAEGAVADRVRWLAANFEIARCGPIFLGANEASGPFVVIDGNHRATAIRMGALSGLAALPVIVAVSKSAPIWKWED
jgi:hypothetical protein